MTKCIRRVLLITAAMACVVLATAARSQQTVEPPLYSGQAPQPPQGAGDQRTELTETVGLLSGLYLYQTYLNIGLLADGKAERVYDEKAARSVLATVVTPLGAVDKQLARIAALPQSEADRQAAARLRRILSLLHRQGRELVAFWDSAHPADGARYEATRQEVWNQLNGLLGLDRK